MNRVLTLAILVIAAAPAALAQTINGPATIEGKGIIYNLNPTPPIVSNNRVHYAAGTAYTDSSGRPRICNGILKIEGRGRSRVQCSAVSQPAPASNVSADSFSTLSPAAGGSPSGSLRKDSTLSSDNNASLRTDKAMVGSGY
jgi:hypothetical protein